MKQCPNCGQKLRSKNIRQCPNCGKQINEKDVKVKQNQAPHAESSNIKLRKFIPWAIVIFIIILMIIVFYLVRNYNSPEAQTKILVNAIDNNDSQKVATLLSTKETHVDIEEADEYIAYVKSEVGMKKFIHDVRDTVEKLNKSDAKEATYIKTRAGNNVLRVSKNGTRFLIFDNLSFTAPTKEAVVKPKLETKYEFRAGGKNKTVVADANKTMSLGKFIPGIYSIDADKETEYGKFTGQLKFDFRYGKGSTVEVNENFNEALLTVKLKGKSDLEDNSLKVKINDKEMKYSTSREYGPYPQNKDIVISASGKVKGKTFKSETKTMRAKDLGNINSVELEFDDEAISDYVEKKENEENSLKNKLSNFFSDYSFSLNTAITSNNFDLVSTFFKDNSDIYQKIKDNLGATPGLTQPQILSASQKGNKIETKVQDLNNNGQYQTTDYELTENSDDGTLQFVKAK
ncbi:hypothetical protein MT340_002935 [Staphylococcus sp. NRL 16/872]|uniref:zinc ribbon domain-containing protein n=1 Tax=Staphylococcus sp. NRL 16/872 TaxID=2930131 RepID=UPI001FB1A98C|nr:MULTISPECIES: hypothetical protein [unclassified Staphylococcus]MCJ1655710.1 hypothetical protein [Staphylococcus sp. NRL 21/187]MCJ1661528.1 hypothetical protein [Staphylococcus sp. NRL 18/288]MCJ1667439.1 hypothetical protein [Staphylococcus sp. NRL 19/737]WEN69923.1 hypothetical protein MT340_002935 [Staphylococcus sp. NRL 16/872]